MQLPLPPDRLGGTSSKCSELGKPFASQGAVSFWLQSFIVVHQLIWFSICVWCWQLAGIYCILWVLKDLVSCVTLMCKPDWCCSCYKTKLCLGLSGISKLCRGIFLSASHGWLLLLLFFLHLWEFPAAWLFPVELLCPCMSASKWVEGVSYCRQKKGVNSSLCNYMLILYLNSCSAATDAGLVPNALSSWLVIGFYSSN